MQRCIVLLALACLPIVQALYEDEVGQYEWHVEHIGQPLAMEFSADSSDRVLVTSASGVLASVSIKDGSMQWRRIASNDPVRFLRSCNKGVVTATDKGLVQGWKGSGDLTWQREFSGEMVDLLLVGAPGKQVAVVVQGDDIEARSITGKHEWSLAASVVGSDLRFWAASPADATAFCAIVGATGDRADSAMSVRVEIESGKVLEKVPMNGAVMTALQSGSKMVVDSNIVFLQGTTLSFEPMCGGAGGSFDLKSVKGSGDAPFRLLPWQRTAGVFAVSNGVVTVIVGLGPKGLKNLRTFEGHAVVGQVLGVHDDESGQPVAVAMTKAQDTQIQLLDPASGNVQPALHVQGYTATDHGDAALLLVRELSSGEHRIVLSAADHSIAGVQGSTIVWAREEALASINHAVMHGRPHAPKNPLKDHAGENAFSQFLDVMLDLLNSPADIVAWVSDIFVYSAVERQRSSILTMMPNTKIPSNGEELRAFGADKLIIAATRASKIFALDATTSEIVWTRYLGDVNVNQGEAACVALDSSHDLGIVGGCGIWMRLLFPGQSFQSELLVVTVQDDGKHHTFSWMDPLTGKVLHEESLPENIHPLSISELPKHSKGGKIRPVIVVDSNHAVHTLPSGSKEALELLAENGERMFHYEVNRETSTANGYAVGKHSKSGEQIMPIWNLDLGSVGEKIVAAVTLSHREWEHVPVYIKGDASILYKYLNRNLVAIAAVEASASKGNVSAISLYALDSVTGHVLHQSRIVGGAAPVHLVACDNWVVMHYWNAKKTRFEVTVVEFFHSKHDDGPWNLLFGPSLINQTKSAHYLEAPVPLQQTYIAPAGVTAVGVTATAKGITPRSILMAMTTDHIFRVSKDQLNPRRQYAGGDKDDVPTQFAPTKEEGMPPYAPVMHMRPTDVLTHSNSMTRVAGIVSSPTGLESTSLVFAYGLDMFFSPVQTARAYDVLSPGFNYKLLYVSVALVVALFIVTSYIASYKALQERWK